MKSSNEISQWLTSQKWFEQLSCNIDREKRGSIFREAILNGNSGMCTISSAFVWTFTPEGYDYWLDIDRQFIQWFMNQPKLG